MRNFIASSDEVLIIKELENFKWEKRTVPVSDAKLFEFESVKNNISENGCFYFANSDDMQIFGFLSEIGRKPHPLIEISYAASWYNSNFGGIYLVAFDKEKKEYFAPIA